MRLSLKSVVAGLSSLALSGAILAAGTTSAAAVPPPYDPDPDAYGTIAFYDAAGNQITSGDARRSDWYKYAVASTLPPTTDPRKRAQLFGYLPVAGVEPGNWSGQGISTNTPYPNPSAPAAIAGQNNPTVTANGTGVPDYSLMDLANNYPQLTTGPLANTYQLRMKTRDELGYASASVVIDKAAGTWTQIYPVPVTATTTVLSANKTSPQNAPASYTLTASVSPSGAAGTVEFFDESTSLGAPTAVSGGVATKALSNVPAGSHDYTAKFVPTDPAAYQASTSNTLTFVVQAPKPTPTVALSSDKATAQLGDPVTFTATVSAPNAPGTVEFFDEAASLGAAGATNAGGVASLTTSALASGAHQVTAKFVPTDTGAYNGSTSPAVTVSVVSGACAQTGSQCTDPQGFVVTVPVGSLVIDSPYTAANPFDLGTMKLNADSTMLSTGAVAFGSGTDGKGVTITDQRSGDLPWTANLQSSPFVSGPNAINPRNLGFTQVAPQYVSGNALNGATKPVVTTDNPASNPAVGPSDSTTLTGLGTSKTFASAVRGAGSVFVTGNFTLNAPTSTPAGTYTGTVTFTIS